VDDVGARFAQDFLLVRLQPDAVGQDELGRSEPKLVEVLDVLAVDELLHELDLFQILRGMRMNDRLLLPRDLSHLGQ
jgi:hypothetical protein